jgi:PRTRC genetic system ThiF family protein
MRLSKLVQGKKTPSLPAKPPELNLGFAQASRVITRDFRKVQIVVAGCGGIGAYMVQHIGRLMKVLYDDQRGVNLVLADPDVVEEKNLGRQLFCDAEVGQPKAIALARRYGQAWGLNTMAFEGEYSESLLLDDMDLAIIVGCVDNAAARVTLHETLQRNPDRITPHALPTVWWLDCGNAKDTGRVCLGSAYSEGQVRGAFVGKRQAIALPSPALQYPTLLIPQKDELPGAQMSCAELQMANIQSLNINAAIAVQAADMLTRLLITGDLKRYQCAVNLASGSVKSFYCTPDEVAREIDRSVEFVTRDNSLDETESAATEVVLHHLAELTEATA